MENGFKIEVKHSVKSIEFLDVQMDITTSKTTFNNDQPRSGKDKYEGSLGMRSPYV